MTGWRYLVFSEPDRTYLGEVHLADVSLTRTLSGPGELSAILEPGQDASFLSPWHVSIWAEDESGRIRGGGFLVPGDISTDGPMLECVGFSGYPQGMPWVAAQQKFVQADPLNIVRAMWSHLQSQAGGAIGVTVDSTTSPVRIGTPAEDVSFTTGGGETVEFEAGPYSLDWWSSHDLGKLIDDLAVETPFDYLEHTVWGGDTLAHRLELGYPSIGVRRRNIRFELGVNVAQVPSLMADEDSYATEVHALGAGEAQAMVHTRLTRDSSGVRRVVTYVDKSARSKDSLSRTARLDLAWRDGAPTLEHLRVIEHSSAPLSSFDVGDVVHVTGGSEWADIDRWVRIVSRTDQPGSAVADLTVQEV